MGVIRDQAIEDGMTTLKQDGIAKIFSGHTDLLQVRKVCIK
jgi:type II secretory ATPase GspE/PulE/Tfp pilus assembly ATPase PilB-like protein